VKNRNDRFAWICALGFEVAIGSSACGDGATPASENPGSGVGTLPDAAAASPDAPRATPDSGGKGGPIDEGGVAIDGGSADETKDGGVGGGSLDGNASQGADGGGDTAREGSDASSDANTDVNTTVDGLNGPDASDARIAQYPLVVALTGSGHGTVTSNVGGIECGGVCAALFDQGTTVILSAVPDPGLVFAGWSIPECPGAGPCAVAINAPRSIAARFFRPVRLSDVDKSPDVFLSNDRLGMQQLTLGRQGVRSDTAVSPGSGIFYFEAQRLVDAPFIELGVATAAVPLDSNLGDTDQTFGVDTGGTITGGGNFIGNFDVVTNAHYGFVVDYRQAHPVVQLVVVDAGAPKVGFMTELSNVTGPLYIFLGGLRQNIGIQASINPGNDTTNFPFFYDPKALLRAAGIDGADQLVLGWGDSYAGVYDQPPSLQVSADQSVPLGSPVTVTATATDAEDGNLTARIAWGDLATPLGARVSAAGGTFTLVPNALGVHQLEATVTDSGNKVTIASVRVNVTGTLPTANPVRLEPDPLSGAGIELSSDGLSARFTASAKLGIRANQGLLHGFQYFEIHRDIAPMNMGGGVVIQNGNLNPYDALDVPPSCSVNVLGGTWHSLMFHKNFPDGFATTEAYYGFAVDYRGAYPIVYVIVGALVVDTIALTDVTVPIYPMLYGNPTVTPSGSAETINFGAQPFHYDPMTVLMSAHVDVTGLEVRWGAGP